MPQARRLRICVDCNLSKEITPLSSRDNARYLWQNHYLRRLEAMRRHVDGTAAAAADVAGCPRRTCLAALGLWQDCSTPPSACSCPPPLQPLVRRASEEWQLASQPVIPGSSEATAMAGRACNGAEKFLRCPGRRRLQHAPPQCHDESGSAQPFGSGDPVLCGGEGVCAP